LVDVSTNPDNFWKSIGKIGTLNPAEKIENAIVVLSSI